MSKAGGEIGVGAVAGVVAGVVYLAEMAVDLKVARHNTDDLYLLGRTVTSDQRHVRWYGLGFHLVNSAIFGMAYARIAHDRLPGPPWLRGVAVANVENVLLYPLAAFEQRHPGIRTGELASYRNKTAFLQNVGRHIAFGAVLGVMYSRLRSRRPVSQTN